MSQESGANVCEASYDLFAKFSKSPEQGAV